MKNTSNQARPCLVTPVTRSGAITEPIKALFYGLVKVQEVVLPSYLEGRKIKDDIVAVVELEDGTIRKVPLERVHLLDSAEKFAEYDWEAKQKLGHPLAPGEAVLRDTIGRSKA